MLSIEVEATSANVCVGFDVLGIALNLKNTFTFELKDEFSFKGFEPRFSDVNHNLVYDSYVKVFEKAKATPIPVEIGFSGDIPVSRGLGSSSSLIVAGIFAANYYLKNKFSKEELFDIATEIEGHPDNVAPAIYGGLVASYSYQGRFYPNIYPISKDLKFMVVIPPFELSTHEARGVLPKVLPYKDIVNNTSRIVNIPRAFERGDVAMLKRLFNDTMHEPYRGPLIQGYAEIKELLKDDEAAFAISGSGSTMLIVAHTDDALKKIAHLGYEMKVLTVGEGVQVKEV